MSLGAGIEPHTHVIKSSEVDFKLPIPYENLKGKTVLITGGSSGLGAGFSEKFAECGANVIIGDINGDLGTSLVAKLRQSSRNENHHFIKLDVTDWQSQARYFREAARLSPNHNIDCVIANAGINGGLDSAEFENPPDYTQMENPPVPSLKVLDVNLTGVMYTTTLALSYLSRNPGSRPCSPDAAEHAGDRHLLLISSIAGMAALPTQSLYCVSKHGVLGLFRSLRLTAPLTSGVRVNCLHPYFVKTPILESAGELVMAGAGLARIEDVVDAAVRLTANQSIIGRALMIGATTNVEQLKAIGFGEPYTTQGDKAIWDVYGDDFAQTDIFTRRVVAATNLVAQARGWVGFIGDVAGTLTAPVWKLLGR